MGTSRVEIRQWLLKAKAADATHMLVVCDTFDYEDYPVDVMPGEDVRTVFNAHNGPNMQRVMECYALHLDIEAQLTAARVFNFEAAPFKAPISASEFIRRARDAQHDSFAEEGPDAPVPRVLPQIGWKK